MTSPLDKLIGLARVSIEEAMASPRWERELERILTTAHTAAYITATAERLGVPPDSALLSRQRLSRAERQDIAKAVEAQLAYLRRFAAERGQLSDAQALARARLYASSMRPFYYAQRWAGWEIPPEILPGLQACLGNCRCYLSDIRDNGDGTGVITRVMGGEDHCRECPPLAGDHVVRRKAA